ncbi:MAG: hypothetical protein JNL92_09325 [Opitutaceae bacterium]|nr:hypothetical protein [Opitutaceae bacterium]
MRQRLQLGLVFFAWLMATGSQWDLVQVVAWGRMFTGYSSEMSLAAAAKKTFSGELCSLCQVAQDGRKQQESGGDTAPPTKSAGKMLDLCPLTTSTPVLSPVSGAVGSLAAYVGSDGRGRASPPSPPPRV